MRIRSNRLQQLYSCIEDITAKAYRSIWLIANPVLARSPHSRLFERCVGEAEDIRFDWKMVLKNVCLYYINNGWELLSAFRDLLKVRLTTSAPSFPQGGVVLVDTVLYLEKLKKGEGVPLFNMLPLEGELTNSNTPFALTPGVYGNINDKSVDILSQAISRTAFPVLLWAHIFRFYDVLKLCAFYLGYPFALLKFLVGIERGHLNLLVASEMLSTLAQPVIHSYSRYLYGRGLAREALGKLTVISWCENRAGDKLFYKGLRAGDTEVNVVGVQTFLFPDHYVGCYFNRSDVANGLSPDRLVVNGRYYLPSSIEIPARVGVSMRYKDMLETPALKELGDDVLILLSYNKEASRRLLELLNLTTCFTGLKLLVRVHPSQSCQEWEALLPSSATISSAELVDDIHSAQVVIGTETGALVEAVAFGIPTVEVDTMGPNALMYMPELGRDDIWFHARSVEDLEQSFESAKSVPREKRMQFARQFRETFFCLEKESIMESFGLSRDGSFNNTRW